MHSFAVRMSTASATLALLLVVAAPGAAAQSPDDNASCLATVFQTQAVDAPRTVSDRILFIRDVLLQGDQFGQVLKPLAQSNCP